MNFKMILEKEEFIELYNRYIKIRFPDSFGIDLYNNNISLKYYDVKHLQFFTTEIGSNFIIVFLGSNERKDWFFNFLFRKKEVPYKEKGTNKKIKVHSGFYKSYLVVRDIVHKELKGKRSVLFLGQSFGSAVATLAALDVQYNFPEIHTIENYITGTPRVGNKYFVDSYNKRVPRTYRLINGYDLVNTVPFEILGFKHVSQEILLKKKGNINIFNFIVVGIKNHLPKEYFKSIIRYFK